MNESLQTKSWESLTNDEKLDRLTLILTRAGSDKEFRKRCLSSPEAARQAVSEEGKITFSPDFEVQFLTPEERLKKLVLAVPDFIPPQDGVAEVRNAEDHQLCTYIQWRS